MSGAAPRAPIVAERPLLLDRGGGERQAVIVRIRAPEPADDGRWCCRVALVGLFADEAVVAGVDAWQALMLAQGVLRDALAQACGSAGRLHWVDGSGELTAAELFGG